jgi:AcrR family transcriptional regulator
MNIQIDSLMLFSLILVELGAHVKQNEIYDRLFETKVTKGELKRKQILEAVIKTINSDGIEKVTFDFVAKELKMRPSHVAYYFRNRRKLIVDSLYYVAAIAQEITTKRVEKANSWEGRVSAIIDGAFEWLERYPSHASAMTLFYYYCTCDSDQRKAYSAIKEIGLRRLMAVLEPAAGVGLLPAGSVEILSRGIQALLAGNILHLVTAETRRSGRKRVREETTHLAFSLINNYPKLGAQTSS